MGQELPAFSEKEVRIWIKEIPAMADVAVHMYKKVNRESKSSLLKLVIRDCSNMDIIKLEQRDRGLWNSWQR